MFSDAVLGFACTLIAGAAVAQSANPEARRGPPPRIEVEAPACPDGQIYDLGVCVPPMSEQDARRCYEALQGAAQAPPQDRAQLLLRSCVVVPLPAVCSNSMAPGECTRAVCESEGDVARFGVCDLGELDSVVPVESRCEFDAIAVVPAILSELSPGTPTVSAESAAIRLHTETLGWDPMMLPREQANQIETALAARRQIATFLAVRFALCDD